MGNTLMQIRMLVETQRLCNFVRFCLSQDYRYGIYASLSPVDYKHYLHMSRFCTDLRDCHWDTH
jgi:hypothetical protein